MSGTGTQVPGGITVKVRSMEGKTVKIKALDNWSLGRFRGALTEWYTADAESYTLLYRGKQLTDTDNETTLKDLEIGDDSLVQLVKRSVGGLFPSI